MFLFGPPGVYTPAPLCFAPFASPRGGSGCGVICIEPLCCSAPVVLRLAALMPPIWQGVLAPASGSPAADARSITPPALVSWPGAPFSGCGRTCLWFRYGLFSFRVRACLSAYCSQAAMPGSVGEPSSYACAAVAGSSAWSRLVAMPLLVVFRLCRAMSALPLPLLGHLP